jgi:hypothetical protein
MGENKIEQKEPKQGEFEQTGGKILEKDAKNIPTRWLCGKKDGQRVDPLGVDRSKITHSSLGGGEWEGTTLEAKDEDLWQG